MVATLVYFTQYSAALSLLLAAVLLLILVDHLRGRRRPPPPDRRLPEPPSPKALPIIGHLHLLAGYEVPFQAFTNLAARYGDVVKLKLGAVHCVVVNGQEHIREVLVTKGHHFDSRPSFERYQKLFGGNKQNSLAFCDWSEMQRSRRDMLRTFTFPRAFTNKFHSLEAILSAQAASLRARLHGAASIEIKPLILETCANIFTTHFCSKTFATSDAKFLRMVKNFDDIFWEVNQGYAADFLPFLLPLHYKNLSKMSTLTHNIRDFILDKIVEKRYESFADAEPSDYVESLIHHVKHDESASMDWETALFSLEDIIGGHSAVGNYLVKVLAFLVAEPQVQRRAQDEIDAVTNEGDGFRAVCLSDRPHMPYNEGIIFEAIRLIASPIVPRVANQDSSLNGFKIAKNTLIFLNNYELSMSTKLWDEPDKFKPERFIVDSHIVKPEHFLPFGGGRRGCMGYKMVQLVSFGILTSLLQHFTIKPVDKESYKVQVGSLALPEHTYNFYFEPRAQQSHTQ